MLTAIHDNDDNLSKRVMCTPCPAHQIQMCLHVNPCFFGSKYSNLSKFENFEGGLVVAWENHTNVPWATRRIAKEGKPTRSKTLRIPIGAAKQQDSCA